MPLAKFAVSFAPQKGDFIGREPLARQYEAFKRIQNRDFSDLWRVFRAFFTGSVRALPPERTCKISLDLGPWTAMAAQSACSLFDVSHMGRILVDGPEAVPFLQHVLSSNVSALDLNQAQYAIIPNERVCPNQAGKRYLEYGTGVGPLRLHVEGADSGLQAAAPDVHLHLVSPRLSATPCAP